MASRPAKIARVSEEAEDEADNGLVFIVLVLNQSLPIMRIQVADSTTLDQVASTVWDSYTGVQIRPHESLDSHLWNFSCNSRKFLPTKKMGTIPLKTPFMFHYDSFSNDAVALELEIEGLEFNMNIPLLEIYPYKEVSSKENRCKISEAIFSPEEIAESKEYRVNKENAKETAYSRYKGCVVPLVEPFSDDETGVIFTFLKSGVNFTKAWDRYLQHSLLRRTKGATSMKWYGLRKHVLYFDPIPKVPRDNVVVEMFLEAKRLRKKTLRTPFKHSKWQNEDEYMQRDIYAEYTDHDSGADFDLF